MAITENCIFVNSVCVGFVLEEWTKECKGMGRECEGVEIKWELGMKNKGRSCKLCEERRWVGEKVRTCLLLYTPQTQVMLQGCYATIYTYWHNTDSLARHGPNQSVCQGSQYDGWVHGVSRPRLRRHGMLSCDPGLVTADSWRPCNKLQ